MLYSALIVGAGQLGSRYLQGLAKSTIPLTIYVCDVSAASLAIAQSRWLEVAGDKTIHSLKLNEGITDLPAELDLAIISTTALMRSEVIKQLTSKANVKNWILEKVLAQSVKKIQEIESVIGKQSKAWVNTPYRIMGWYNQIKSKMNINGNFICEIKAGKTFGLASNTIHYLDLLVWLSGETITEIKTDQLDTEWYQSKRAGFWDVYGTMQILFSKGSKAVLKIGTWEPSKITIDIKTAGEQWMIQESDGIATRNDGFIIKGRDEYQSEMTAPLVESILQTGTCLLPSLKESAAIHLPMIQSFLDHWNSHMPEKLKEVPIT